MADLVDKFYSADLSESEEEALDGLLASSLEAAGRFAQKAAEAYDRYGLPDPDSRPGRGSGWRGLGLWALALVLMASYGLWQVLWKVKPTGTIHMPGLYSNTPASPVSGSTGSSTSVGLPEEEITSSGKPGSSKPSHARTRRFSNPLPVKESKTQTLVSKSNGVKTVPPMVSSQGPVSGSFSTTGADKGPTLNPSAMGSGQSSLRPEIPPPLTPGFSTKGYSRLKIDLAIGQNGPVTVRILDSAGADVKSLYSGSLAAGTYSFTWDGKLDNGKTAPPGQYQIESRNDSTVQDKEFWIQPKRKAAP